MKYQLDGAAQRWETDALSIKQAARALAGSLYNLLLHWLSAHSVNHNQSGLRRDSLYYGGKNPHHFHLEQVDGCDSLLLVSNRISPLTVQCHYQTGVEKSLIHELR